MVLKTGSILPWFLAKSNLAPKEFHVLFSNSSSHCRSRLSRSASAAAIAAAASTEEALLRRSSEFCWSF